MNRIYGQRNLGKIKRIEEPVSQSVLPGVVPVSVAEVQLGVGDDRAGLVDVGGLVKVLGGGGLLLAVLPPEAPVTHCTVQRHRFPAQKQTR